MTIPAVARTFATHFMLTYVSYVVCIWTVDPPRPTRHAVGRLGAQFGLVLDHRRGYCGCDRAATQLDLVLLTVKTCGLRSPQLQEATSQKNLLEPKFFTELSTIIPATPTTSRRTPPSRQSSGLASTSGSLAGQPWGLYDSDAAAASCSARTIWQNQRNTGWVLS